MPTFTTSSDYSVVPQDESGNLDADTAQEKIILNDAEQHTSLTEQEPLSWLWIYVLSIANFGISGAWALEFAITTPYFEKGLKSGSVLSHGVWVVGPLSGLIIAPIVGTLSDRCTHRWGRRRPFILIGIIFTVLGMLIFAHANEIAALFFSRTSPAHHTTAIITAIIAFSILDLAINTTMWPVRALQGDLVPDFQQHSVQSAALVMGSLGDLAANELVRSFDEPVSNIRTLFVISAAFYAITTTMLLIVGRETPVEPDDLGVSEARAQPLNLLTYLHGLPEWMWRIGGTYAIGFFAFFCATPNASSWVGSSVLGGDPNAAKGSKESLLYERGVKEYGKAGQIRALVMIVFSVIYPMFLNFGVLPGQLLGLSFGIFSVLCLALARTHSLTLAKALVIVMALPMTAQFTLPAMTVEKSDESNRGRFLGVLNCFAVIPQLIDTGYTGIVSKMYGEDIVMLIGGVWGLLAALSAFVVLRKIR